MASWFVIVPCTVVRRVNQAGQVAAADMDMPQQAVSTLKRRTLTAKSAASLPASLAGTMPENVPAVWCTGSSTAPAARCCRHRLEHGRGRRRLCVRQRCSLRQASRYAASCNLAICRTKTARDTGKGREVHGIESSTHERIGPQVARDALEHASIVVHVRTVQMSCR